MPECVADDGDARLLLRRGFHRAERTAERKWNARRFEEVRRDRQPIDALCLGAGAKVQTHLAEPDDRFENPAVPEVAIVQVRELVAVAGLHPNDPRAAGDRGLAEEHRTDCGEQRQVDAESEAERQNTHQDKTRAGTKEPERAAQVR